jgi:hypothetical protein
MALIHDNTTPNRAYQEPALGNDLATDVGRIISALRAIDVDVANALAQIVAKAPLASPTFTGVPIVPTAAPGTDTGQAASTAFVAAALAALVGLAPSALDTIYELATASEANSDLIDLLEAAVAMKADAAATTAALAGKADAAATTAALATKAPLDLSGLTAKTTPVDADLIGLGDSAASFGFKKLTFANLWTWVSGKVLTLFNASGSAPVYACRAWVAFTDTGTVAILGSGNVTSVVRISTGVYEITMTTAMADTNYAVLATARDGGYMAGQYATPKTTTVFRVSSTTDSGALVNPSVMNVLVTR